MRTSLSVPKFPQSALLFRFCFQALEKKRQGQKVHDQELGNLLNFNPSDTSHWKKGKKGVRSIVALESLSSQLDLDFELLEDIAEGKVDFEEAMFEYQMAQDERKVLSRLTPDGQITRRERFYAIDIIAKDFLKRANILSVPVFVPEILDTMEHIRLQQTDIPDRLTRALKIKPGQYTIRFRKGEQSPHVRVAIATELARILLTEERRDLLGLPDKADELLPLEIQELAFSLLVPTDALREEVGRIPQRSHLTQKLSEVFWVPRCVIRARLTSLLLSTASDESLKMVSLPVQRLASTQNLAILPDMGEDDR